MRPLFTRRIVAEPAVRNDDLEAYREGRADEHAKLQRAGVVTERAAGDAYERGRHDERLRRRGSPVLGLVTLALVVIGLGVVLLAIRTGSFSNAGATIDNLLQTPVHRAADKAGTALETAGRDIKNEAGSNPP